MARIAIHPGEHIADDLTELGMSASELARTLNIPTNRITEIIRGRRGISADTALRLSQWMGTTPEYWMNLQRNYELRLAEQERGDEIRRDIKPLQPAST
jgi:addiction module HigA family antidote